MDTKAVTCMKAYLLVSLEDIASEAVVWYFTSDVAEDLHVL